MTTVAEDAARTAEYWSQNVAGSDPFGPDVYWLAVPAVQAHFRKRACGGLAYANWCAYMVDHYLAPRGLPVRRMLSIGCGTGTLERQLHGLGAFTECIGCDIAPGAIDIARSEAAAIGATGLGYIVSDVQQQPLPRGPFDAVWFNGSLHHIRELESVLADVRSVLQPNGYLFFNEYVGARHFEFPPRQRELIECAFQMLPPRYRRSFTPATFGQELHSAPLPDWQNVRAADPSEAVRSNEIIGAVETFFDIATLNRSGGSILHFLLAGLAGHFRDSDPAAMRYLDLLIAYEDTLIDTGDLASDFVVVAARPKL